MNHRVKNSLQLVLSMLSLQGQEFKEPDTRELFTKAIARVTAIASIHERLYQDARSAHGRDADVSDRACARSWCALGHRKRTPGELADPKSKPMRLPTEHGVSVALVVNELVMNALKHARPSSGPAIISVRLVRHGPGRFA